VRRFLPLVLRTVGVIICLSAAIVALFLRTVDKDLPPCSVTTEFFPCGNQIDYRIWLRIGFLGAGVGVSIALFILARRIERRLGTQRPIPTEVDVLVTDGDDALIARGAHLRGERPTPIARLTLSGGAVLRENIWPTESDLGSPVILPGGEIGLLTSWWNEDDGSAWRWTIELSNHRDVD
jgi:hypothetical protein